MNKLFESNKKVTDTLIQFRDRPYISYEEISLTKAQIYIFLVF